LAATLFQSEKRAAVFYFALIFSSVFVFLLQVFHTVFKAAILSSPIFPFSAGTVAGSWNDFAVFFGLTALLALCFLELANFGKLLRSLFFGVAVMSLLAMLAANFPLAWVVFGSFVFILFVYLFYSSLRATLAGNRPREGFVSPKIIRPSFFILIFALSAILARGWLGGLTKALGTGAAEVSPSWSATANVVWRSLEKNPVLGSGPNTFTYDWLKYGSAPPGGSALQAARLASGTGRLPSMAASAGALGGVSLLVFLFFVIYYGAKILSYGKDDFKRILLLASFLGSLYLLSFTVFYSPGFLVFALAFLLAGTLAGVLAGAGMIKVTEISFVNNPKTGFVSVLLIFLCIAGAVFGLSVPFRQYHAERYYTKSVKAAAGGDIGEAERYMEKAALIGKRDEYFRELSKLNLVEMKQILSQRSVSADVLRPRLRDALGAAIANAKRAAELNPLDVLNWMQIGAVYESVMPLKVPDAPKLAMSYYKRASAVSPFDPNPFLAMARVSFASGDAKAAKNYLKSSLVARKDFVPAYFLLSQIEAKSGDLKEAAAAAERAAFLAPNNIDILFQLGLLDYQGKNYSRAQAIFNRIVSLSPGNSNANYFLGLVYDKLGERKKAIGVFEKVEKLNPSNREVKLVLRNLRSGKPALSGISATPAASSKKEKKSSAKK